jgi:hypothetical protein
MRLTLRTLLAWLDGVLPPADQEELATKVAASPVAPKLIERIRDVLARPGLAAPRPDGRGLADDPNTVAEFLDNVLPAEQLEAFERVCIESDVHMAEAADCHAMLAEMARDPGAVAPLDRRLRKRLSDEMARVAEQSTPAPAAHPVTHRAPSQARPSADALVAAMTFEETVSASRTSDRGIGAGRPPTGRKASWGAWLSAAVAALLLLGLVGLLAWSLLVDPSGGRQVAAARKEAAAVLPQAVAPPPADDEPVAPVDADAGAMPQPADEPDSVAAAGAPGAAAPAAVAALPAREPRVVPEPPRPNPPPSVPLPEMELAGPEPAAPPPPPPAAPAVPPGAVVEGGALLHRVGEGDQSRWKPLAAGDPLGDVEEFAVPAHAFPRVMRGDVSIRLYPGTLAALVTDADGSPRLEVVFGKAVAWTEAAEAALGVTAGGLSGVAMVGKGQPLGISVELTREPGTDPAVVPPGRRALLHASGGVRWRQTEIDGGPPGQPLAGLAIEQPLPPRSDLEWTSIDPATARITPIGLSPDWMQRQAAATRPEQAAGAELARRFAAQGADAVEVEATLRQMATDRRVENRMAAAATAALLGDYGPAVSLLCAESADLRLRDGQWAECEAATVQQALGRGANAAATLRQAFAAHGPAGRGDELYLLARGLSPEELAAGGATALVDSLADGAVVVRRYAFRNLLAAFPDDPAARVEYRPDRPPGLNDKGVEWWRRKVAGAAAPAP